MNALSSNAGTFVSSRVRRCVPDDFSVISELHTKVCPAGKLAMRPEDLSGDHWVTLGYMGKSGGIEMVVMGTAGSIPGILVDPACATADHTITAFLELFRAWRSLHPDQVWPPIAAMFPAPLRDLEERLRQLGILGEDLVHVCALSKEVFEERTAVN